jgi:hypothetical protein
VSPSEQLLAAVERLRAANRVLLATRPDTTREQWDEAWAAKRAFAEALNLFLAAA